MTEERFIQLGQEILNEMRSKYDKEAYNKVSPYFSYVYCYILKNPNNIHVQQFISELLKIYLNLFLNSELINALSLPDSMYFFKQLQIYNNLPYTTHPEYAWSLYDILNIPQNALSDYYETFLYVLQKYKPEVLANPWLQAIFDFTKQNRSIMRGFKDKYYSLYDEIRFHEQSKSLSMFEALKEFLETEQLMDSYSARNRFRNKRIGNIGELYAFDLIEDAVFKSIVARDVKNGFGYDIYFLDEDSVENLVEVKTTTRYGDDDFFSLSENEYKVMRECAERGNAEYYLCRVKLDSLYNPTFSLLVMKDNVTFVDIQNEGIQYKLHPLISRNVYFKRFILEMKANR